MLLIWHAVPVVPRSANDRVGLPASAAGYRSSGVQATHQISIALRTSEAISSRPNSSILAPLRTAVAVTAENGLDRIGTDAALRFAFLHHSASVSERTFMPA